MYQLLRYLPNLRDSATFSCALNGQASLNFKEELRLAANEYDSTSAVDYILVLSKLGNFEEMSY